MPMRPLFLGLVDLDCIKKVRVELQNLSGGDKKKKTSKVLWLYLYLSKGKDKLMSIHAEYASFFSCSFHPLLISPPLFFFFFWLGFSSSLFCFCFYLFFFFIFDWLFTSFVETVIGIVSCSCSNYFPLCIEKGKKSLPSV